MIKLFLTFLIPMWKYAKDPERLKLSHQCFVSGFSVSSSLSQCFRNWPVRVYANDNAKNSSTGVPLYLSYVLKIIHKFHDNSPKDHQQECWLTLTRGKEWNHQTVCKLWKPEQMFSSWLFCGGAGRQLWTEECLPAFLHWEVGDR